MSRLYFSEQITPTANAKPPRGTPIFYTLAVASRRLDENSTTITAVNSTVETELASLTMPAQTLTSTGAARFSAVGFVSNSAVAGGTVKFRAKLTDGTSTALVAETSGLVASTSTSPRAWGVEGYVMNKIANGQAIWSWLDMSYPAAGINTPVEVATVGYSTSALTDTTSITLTITGQLSSPSTGFSVDRKTALLEGIN